MWLLWLGLGLQVFENPGTRRVLIPVPFQYLSLSTATTAPNVGTTQLALGFRIFDVVKMDPDIAPFAHFSTIFKLQCYIKSKMQIYQPEIKHTLQYTK